MYRKRVKNNFTNEQLLDMVRKYRSYNAMHSDRQDDEPSPRIVALRFGSWSAATNLAGVQACSGLREDRETTVYLVRIQNLYYKIGITQMSVLARFRAKGVKDVVLIDSVLMDNLTSAVELEKELLNLVKEARVSPNIEGFTECFEVRDNLTQLSDLYAPLSPK